MEILYIILDTEGNSYYPEEKASNQKFFKSFETALRECKYLTNEGYFGLNVYAVTNITNPDGI